MTILLVDNYDSFAHNLARYVRQLGPQVTVERNDRIEVNRVNLMRPKCIIMSPGPCTPDDAGVCLRLVQAFWRRVPMLGICLGHQAICQSFGARIVESAPVHGRVSDIRHDQHPLFAGVDSPFVGCRYHSLVAERASLPAELQVIAETDDDTVMAVVHKEFPIVGLQFHPESILSDCGYRLLSNYLNMAGFSVDQARVTELQQAVTAEQNLADYGPYQSKLESRKREFHTAQ